MARETNVKMTPGNVPGQETETTETAPQDSMDTKYAELAARVENQSKLLSKVLGQFEKLSTATKPPATETPEQPEAKTLTARQQKLEQEWADKVKKQNERAIRQTIAGALQNEGIADPELAKRQANFLKSELAARIAVNDEDMVTIDDGGEQVDVQKYIHAYLQTPEGNWLLPAKNPPNDRAAAKGFGSVSGKMSNDGKMQLTRSEYSRGNHSPAVKKAIATGAFDIVD